MTTWIYGQLHLREGGADIIIATVAKPSSTRERIIAGAAEAFGRMGYGATRVEDIIVSAAVSRPTFYKFFKDKDEVFAELSLRHHNEILSRLAEATGEAADPLDSIDRSADAFLRWRAGLGPIGRVLDTEGRLPNSRLQDHRKRTLDAVIKVWQTELREAARGEVDPLIFRALIEAGETVADSLNAGKDVSEAQLARCRSVLSRIVRATLAQPGDSVPELPLASGRGGGGAKAESPQRRRKRSASQGAGRSQRKR